MPHNIHTRKKMPISLTGTTTYTENFNTLAITGTSSTLPLGWELLETLANANLLYAAGTGGSTTGDTYSFGSAGSTDRALGGLQSGNLVPTIGVSFTNNSGSTITSLSISYRGEQWRLGATSRVDRLDFQYSLNATSVANSTFTWIDVNTLDFTAPTTTGTAGPLDGNAPANAAAFTGTISGLSIADGATFYLRWTDFNPSGADDGLAIDDFSLTPTFASAPALPTVAIVAQDDSASEAGSGTGTFRISRTGDTTSALTVNYAIATGAGQATSADYNETLTGGTATIAIGQSFVDITITPVDDAAVEGTETVTLTLSGSANYTLGTNIATVNIIDNDAPVTDYTIGGFSFNVANIVSAGSVITTTQGSAGFLSGLLDSSGSPLANKTVGAILNVLGGSSANSSLTLGEAPIVGGVVDNRAEVELTWGGDRLANDAGNDFVIYENGNTGLPEGYAVAVRRTSTGQFTNFLYQFSNSFDDAAVTSSVDSDGVFATAFDLSAFGLSAGEAIDAIRIVNLTESAKVSGADGQGFVDFTGTNGFTPLTASGGSAFANSSLDPDITLVAALRNLQAAPTKISAIQGSGTAAIAGTFTIEGIVVGDFQGVNQLGGFYLQEEDTDADGNVFTSEAIFVNSLTAVNVGDKVQVTGTVQEDGLTPSFNQAVITPTTVSVIATGQQALVTATILDLPTTALGDLERYEGMLITIPETLTVTEVFNLGRFGEVSLSANGRLFNPTNIIDPNDVLTSGTSSSGSSNVAAITAQQNLNNRSRIILDDGSTASNLSDVPYIDTTDANPLNDTLRIGSTTTGITGVLGFGFSNYRIQPTVAPIFNYEPRPELPTVGGSLKVGSFNVLNYFNGDGSGGGFPTSRGADTAIEFNRQRAKIIAAIKELNADVVGLIEVENDGDGPNSAIADLVNGLNAAIGSTTYAFIPLANTTGSAGTDEIKVAFIYKPSAVTPVGSAAYFNDPAFTSLGRPPLAQTFSVIATGEKFTPIINHFKSKSATNASGLNLDQGDGQGAYNDTRKIQATALLNFVSQIQTASGDSDVMILGDLNAYTEEDPIDILRAGGLTKLVTSTDSYVFDGQTGSLDHALVTSSLLAQVTGVAEWNINSSEPIALDYNDNVQTTGTDGEQTSELRNDTTLYQANPFRSSDHDPLLVGLNLGSASLSGFTYLDANNNGIFEGTESALAGITIALTGTAVDGSSVTRTTVTATNGSYQFTNLQSGTYALAETQLTGFNDGIDTVGSLGGSGSVNDVFSNIVVGVGASGTGYNFGELAKPAPTPVVTPIPTQQAASGGSTLTGTSGIDKLIGGAGNDTLIGLGGRDQLTGGLGSDTFRYQAFTDSLYTNVSTNNQLDNIVDFNQVDGDRIRIASFTPSNLFNAGVITAANLQAAIQSVYGDRDPSLAGNQALNANEAVFFKFGVRSYVSVNDGTSAFSNSNDLVIDVTNLKYKSGDEAIGQLAVSNYFS